MSPHLGGRRYQAKVYRRQEHSSRPLLESQQSSPAGSDGSFSTREHVIPGSLGNDELVLIGEVWDACQRYFGKEVERCVLSKTPLGFWRVFLQIPTKKGKLPAVDLRQTRD